MIQQLATNGSTIRSFGQTQHLNAALSDVSLVDLGNLLGSSDSTNGAFVWNIPEVPFTTSTCKPIINVICLQI
jgi:hypothetical protein